MIELVRTLISYPSSPSSLSAAALNRKIEPGSASSRLAPTTGSRTPTCSSMTCARYWPTSRSAGESSGTKILKCRVSVSRAPSMTFSDAGFGTIGGEAGSASWAGAREGSVESARTNSATARCLMRVKIPAGSPLLELLLLEPQRRALFDHAHLLQVQRVALELAAADEVVPEVPADDDVRAVALPGADGLALDLGVGLEAREALERVGHLRSGGAALGLGVADRAVGPEDDVLRVAHHEVGVDGGLVGDVDAGARRRAAAALCAAAPGAGADAREHVLPAVGGDGHAVAGLVKLVRDARDAALLADDDDDAGLELVADGRAVDRPGAVGAQLDRPVLRAPLPDDGPFRWRFLISLAAAPAALEGDRLRRGAARQGERA